MKHLLLALTLLVACGSPQGATSSQPVTAAAPVDELTAAAPVAGPCLQGTVELCVLNPNVTQTNIKTTICKSGWTATIRPPTTYTGRLKKQQLLVAVLTHPTWTLRNTEEDHRVPLELGGHPTDPFNLSPEFADAATPSSPYHNLKDDAENAAKASVCRKVNPVPLATAQVAFIATWLGPWPTYLK